jgi:hypothetical protein
MSLKTVACGLAVAAMGLFATSALAAAWGTASGDAGDFTYSNGQDINGFFGEPWIPGDNTFYYVSANFQVSSANGAPGFAQQSDTTSFDAVADPGLQFSLIRVTAFGSYAVTGNGASVDLDAGLGISENGGMGRNWAGPLTTTPGFPVTAGSGDWSGLSVVDITFELPVPYNSIHVAMANDVVAISVPGSSATINVQFQDLKIEFEVIPEPGTLALLALGGLALLRRK